MPPSALRPYPLRPRGPEALSGSWEERLCPARPPADTEEFQELCVSSLVFLFITGVFWGVFFGGEVMDLIYPPQKLGKLYETLYNLLNY